MLETALKENEPCRQCGKVGDDVIFAPCPYQSEINDDDTPVWLCEDCRYDNALEI